MLQEKLLAGMGTKISNDEGLAWLTAKPLTSFAFGSCNYSTYDQSYWQNIGRDRPDLWIWMGDNIYADSDTIPQRKARYDKLKANAYYTAFRNITPVIGTWDDHDFWSNNRDGSFPDKELSKLAAMDFLEIAPATVEGHEGIYQSYTYGPEGQRTKVILLDLRFNMVQKRSQPASLLGHKQWEWFKSEIGRNDYELLVIGSSQNVLSPSGAQAWASFPAERALLYQLLKPLDQQVLFLSGDRHHGDFSKVNFEGKEIYEFMSSGLTHFNPFARSNPNRIGSPVNQKNYGVVHIDWVNNSQPKLMLELKSPTTGKVIEALEI